MKILPAFSRFWTSFHRDAAHSAISPLSTLHAPRYEHKSRSAAFTLVELLVVVAIIGILAGLLGSAIMAANKTANKKRADNNAVLLAAAINEYRHDFGKWPLSGSIIKEKLKDSEIEKTRSANKVAGSDTASGKLDYSMSFYEDNNEVVKNLLEAKLPNGSTKTYLNLHGFVTPVKTGLSANDYPVTQTVDALLAYEGEAVSDDINSSEESVSKRKDPVLLFRTEMYKCPDCGVITRSKACPNRSDNWAKEHDVNNGQKCPFYDKEGYARPLRNRDRVMGAKPYTIKFDLNDNTVSVKAE